MRYRAVSAGLLCLGMMTAQASAAGIENTLEITGSAGPNTLLIDQSPEAGHAVRVSLGEGAVTAAPLALWRDMEPLGLTGELSPGRIVQTGLFQTLTVSLSGEANLFAATQAGQGNSITGMVQGQFNQAAVMQSGHGNSASFSQIGQRNRVVIRQGGW
ncbi:hypothetical protein [Thalassococcus profundi]|uniref:hypothetical protein n=1 Tax=Thalassococcus profundi TaxID=2282382 RepID=UPI00405905C2